MSELSCFVFIGEENFGMETDLANTVSEALLRKCCLGFTTGIQCDSWQG